MATAEQLAWLRRVLELAGAVSGMRDLDDPGAVIAAALLTAAAELLDRWGA